MKHVYIVMGETGEYSDNRDWSVMAYLDEDKAKARVEAAEGWARENNVSTGTPDMSWDARYALKNPHDPYMQIDYTGVRYYYMTVPLEA